jgi:hypothetical protein
VRHLVDIVSGILDQNVEACIFRASLEKSIMRARLGHTSLIRDAQYEVVEICAIRIACRPRKTEPGREPRG